MEFRELEKSAIDSIIFTLESNNKFQDTEFCIELYNQVYNCLGLYVDVIFPLTNENLINHIKKHEFLLTDLLAQNNDFHPNHKYCRIDYLGIKTGDKLSDFCTVGDLKRVIKMLRLESLTKILENIM
jgi:hypothetical protein